jgi:hypothetical protein
MWDYDDYENPPDVLLDMPYETEIYTDIIFADSHFYIELDNAQAVLCSRSYSQHFQGYMALTPEGVELAAHFFQPHSTSNCEPRRTSGSTISQRIPSLGFGSNDGPTSLYASNDWSIFNGWRYMDTYRRSPILHVHFLFQVSRHHEFSPYW